MKTQAIFCCGCSDDVDAVLVSGADVYPKRKDLKSLPFWQCTTCNNFVGCHHKTADRTRPLGCIPTPEIKKARQHIHRLIDPVWLCGKVKRQDLYARISERIGRTYHTADIRSVDEAREVYRIAKEIIQ